MLPWQLPRPLYAMFGCCRPLALMARYRNEGKTGTDCELKKRGRKRDQLVKTEENVDNVTEKQNATTFKPTPESNLRPLNQNQDMNVKLYSGVHTLGVGAKAFVAMAVIKKKESSRRLSKPEMQSTCDAAKSDRIFETKAESELAKNPIMLEAERMTFDQSESLRKQSNTNTEVGRRDSKIIVWKGSADQEGSEQSRTKITKEKCGFENFTEILRTIVHHARKQSKTISHPESIKVSMKGRSNSFIYKARDYSLNYNSGIKVDEWLIKAKKLQNIRSARRAKREKAELLEKQRSQSKSLFRSPKPKGDELHNSR